MAQWYSRSPWLCLAVVASLVVALRGQSYALITVSLLGVTVLLTIWHACASELFSKMDHTFWRIPAAVIVAIGAGIVFHGVQRGLMEASLLALIAGWWYVLRPREIS